jgi:hypothetical protein
MWRYSSCGGGALSGVTVTRGLSERSVSEVVTGVEGIPCGGLLQQMLADGALVHQSHSGRYCAEDMALR